MNMNTIESASEDTIDIKEIIHKYISNWKWYIISVFTFFLLAFLYNSSTSNLYQVESTILIKDDKNSGVMSEMSAFEDLGIGLNGASSAIEN